MKKRDEDGETYDFPKMNTKTRRDYIENLYPVVYNGKKYDKEDCHDIFVNLYHSRISLNNMSGVYVSEGTWVYPDGTTDHW